VHQSKQSVVDLPLALCGVSVEEKDVERTGSMVTTQMHQPHDMVILIAFDSCNQM